MQSFVLWVVGCHIKLNNSNPMKVGDIVHILSHADDGKWYGVVGDQIGFFYMTFVDHDNISWQESRQQRVDLPHAEVIRDSTPDRDDIGFLQVKVWKD
jgi:hypothetical protein